MLRPLEIRIFGPVMDINYLLFQFLMLLLVTLVAQSLILATFFTFQPTGERRANLFFGVLLGVFGLTLLHYVFTFIGFYDQHPELIFIPLYFTLSFPVLLFYFVKLNLYPNYTFRLTDSKHFLLGAFQFLFFVGLFFTPLSMKEGIEREFFNPFFGALEHALYLILFPSYLYFAYRYVMRKKKWARTVQVRKKVIYLQKLIEILFILFCVNALFLLFDFFSYEVFGLNLRNFKIYAALGVLSFAGMLFWINLFGIQVLMWGKPLFKLDKRGKTRSISSKKEAL